MAPSGDDDVVVVLPANINCTTAGAICASDGSRLKEGVNLTVTGPEEEPEAVLTASTQNVPAPHEGADTSFTFQLDFSEEPKSGLGYETMRDDVFTVTGGDITGARRLNPPNNISWEITVAPSGAGDVAIVLPATTDCNATGAICTADDRMLSNRLEITVPGP